VRRRRRRLWIRLARVIPTSTTAQTRARITGVLAPMRVRSAAPKATAMTASARLMTVCIVALLSAWARRSWSAVAGTLGAGAVLIAGSFLVDPAVSTLLRI
jgi:hypothetical protein